MVEPWAPIVIGMFVGWISKNCSLLLISLRVDDAVAAIPVHKCNGMWGVFAAGLVASPYKMEMVHGKGIGWFYSFGGGSWDASLLECQVCIFLFICGWTYFTLTPFFIWLNYKGWLRAGSLEELVGYRFPLSCQRLAW
jgi:Amt family ammonium transporter